MVNKDKEELVLLFNQGFEELVLPALERLEQGLKDEIKGAEDRLGGKIDNLNRRLDVHATQLGEQERKLKQLESAKAIAHQVNTKKSSRSR